MPWLRVGDGAATHPSVLALAATPDADDRTVNEAFGFLVRCGSLSANHMTDYLVSIGTATLVGGARTQLLLDQCTAAGLLRPTGKGRSRQWAILETDPDLIHMRLEREVKANRRRTEDSRDRALIAECLKRDGSQCRWCGIVVNWRDRKGGAGGTWDHLDIANPTSPATLVVACSTCNNKRNNRPHPDPEWRLRPPPAAPYYDAATVKRLADLGVTVEASPGPAAAGPEKGVRSRRAVRTSSDPTHGWDTASDPAGLRDNAPSERPGSHAPDTASSSHGISDPATGWDTAPSERPDDHASDTASPIRGAVRPHGPPDPDCAQQADLDLPRAPDQSTARSRSQLSQTGRDGSGRDGPGTGGALARPPARSPSSLAGRSRGRRGRRSRDGD